MLDFDFKIRVQKVELMTATISATIRGRQKEKD